LAPLRKVAGSNDVEPGAAAGQESVENFSGEESAGFVEVECVFAGGVEE